MEELLKDPSKYIIIENPYSERWRFIKEVELWKSETMKMSTKYYQLKHESNREINRLQKILDNQPHDCEHYDSCSETAIENHEPEYDPNG